MKNSWNTLPLILSVDDVAQLMCVQSSTIRRWRRTGKISYTRIGKKYFFARNVIYNMLINETMSSDNEKEKKQWPNAE